MTGDRLLQIFLPRDLHLRLLRRANKDGKTLTTLVIELLAEGLHK